jgi:hypothetical protein
MNQTVWRHDRRMQKFGRTKPLGTPGFVDDEGWEELPGVGNGSSGSIAWCRGAGRFRASAGPRLAYPPNLLQFEVKAAGNGGAAAVAFGML